MMSRMDELLSIKDEKETHAIKPEHEGAAHQLLEVKFEAGICAVQLGDFCAKNEVVAKGETQIKEEADISSECIAEDICLGSENVCTKEENESYKVNLQKQVLNGEEEEEEGKVHFDSEDDQKEDKFNPWKRTTTSGEENTMDSFGVERKDLLETQEALLTSFKLVKEEKMDLTNVKVKTEPESSVLKGIHEIANIKTEDTCIKQEFSVKEEQLQYVDEVVVCNDVDGDLHIQEEAQCDKKVKLEDKSDLHLTNRNVMTTSEKLPVSTIGTSLTNSIGNGEKYIGNLSRRRNEQRTNFTCDVCKKTFSQRKYLIKHLQIHSGIRFFCKVCGKSFSQKSGLSIHKRRHTGLRYFCELCGKSFTDQRNLHVHIRRHTGGRFSCEICGKPFPLKIDLTKHMESHIDDI